MTVPVISPLPAAPTRADAPSDFTAKADAFVAAQVGMVTEFNASAAFVDQRAIDADASATASAGSASAAADSATSAADQVVLATEQAELATSNGQTQVQLAADQVTLAADQVALATQQAVRSEDAADQAEIAAAAAGASAGLPALTGNANKALIVKQDESGVQFATVGAELKRSARISNAQIGLADKGQLIDITSGTFTQTFAACSALGDGWLCYIRNAGSGDITLDPDGGETIDGLASFVMYPGECRLIQCDGAALRSIVLNSFYKVFTASSAFITPPGYAALSGLVISGGGGGYSTAGGGGGGGGGAGPLLVPANPGESINVVVGSGGAPVSVGGASSFGSFSVTGGTMGQPGGGGAGGGMGNASAGSDGFGGGTSGAAAVYGGGGGGTTVGGRSVYGGGGGAGGGSATGGASTFAGAGGASGAPGVAPGGGGGVTSSGARGEVRILGII